MGVHGSRRPAVAVAEIIMYRPNFSKAIQRCAASPSVILATATETPVMATLDPSVIPTVLSVADACRSSATRTGG
jgi:hypothetical protein